jgi:tetratricopeptide (TPR) repeat protein
MTSATDALPSEAPEDIGARAPDASLRLTAAVAGDAAARDTLRRLTDDLKGRRAAEASLPHLRRAVSELKQARYPAAAAAARKALAKDKSSPHGWYLLAIALDKSNLLTESLDAYERALALAPENLDIVNSLGRLAYRLKMFPQAVALLSHYVAATPGAMDATNNLALALRDNLQYDEAVEVLKPVIQAHAHQSMLWNTLGTILSDKGELAQAVLFLEEALRLDPANGKARYNLATARLFLGDTRAAVADCDAALPHASGPDDRAMMSFARATMLLASGDLPQGWEAYESRFDPHYVDPVHFLVDRPRWAPGDALAGKRLMLFGEQGLGDEILFANMLPQLIEAVGPDGSIALACEPRLAPLFRRSFPQILVGHHYTTRHRGRLVRAAPFIRDWEAIDLWSPIGSLLRRFRTRLDDFPRRPEGFLVPDPGRVAHWKREMAGALPGGPKVGLLWTSLIINASRFRYFPQFEAWKPVLQTPGAAFVNLQYGDCAAELAHARDVFGVEVWDPPGIDLKRDLDDLAALCCAMDAIVGPSNATSNIAAGCGAPVWLVSTPGSWPRLGTDYYPWYPQVRAFVAPALGVWEPVMAEVAQALSLAVRQGTEAAPAG